METIKKKIELEVEFPKDFTPPEEFDGVEWYESTGKCKECPFYCHESYEPYEWCGISVSDGNECPISPFFE